jgi:hypothetical protein
MYGIGLWHSTWQMNIIPTPCAGVGSTYCSISSATLISALQCGHRNPVSLTGMVPGGNGSGFFSVGFSLSIFRNSFPGGHAVNCTQQAMNRAAIVDAGDSVRKSKRPPGNSLCYPRLIRRMAFDSFWIRHSGNGALHAGQHFAGWDRLQIPLASTFRADRRDITLHFPIQSDCSIQPRVKHHPAPGISANKIPIHISPFLEVPQGCSDSHPVGPRILYARNRIMFAGTLLQNATMFRP